MGSRANYIISNKDSVEFFYCKWGAQVIPENIFWGQQETISMIRTMDQSDTLYYNDKWCEGAVLIDVSNKLLVFYGGEDLLWSNILKRFYCALLRITWDGWKIRWAKNGLYTIVEGLNKDIQNQITTEPNQNFKFDINKLMEYLGHDNTIISIRKGPKLKHFEMIHDPEVILYQGPNILTRLFLMKSCMISKQSFQNEFTGFIYIDMDSKVLYYDSEAERHHKMHDILSKKWEGWTFQEHNQGIYKHTQLCDLPWEEYMINENSIINALREILLRWYIHDEGDKAESNKERDRKEIIFKNAVQEWQNNDDHFENTFKTEIW